MTILWTGMALMSLGVVLRPLEHYGERYKDGTDEGVLDEPDDEGGDEEDGKDPEESEDDES